ncbi:MAG: hypothetical protein E5X67_23420 [Mesorhizobium sp.]|uniref:hypothetical protein n=1 Tax=Mesorhizobium sp. TaxID=1871066 RepID=UPI0012287726|nr:hypothetical protein [Mesorhizobium sp.]TIP25746.1 MAG: hypothetical protein E5X67_23420 [Mesorhizobium sp.]
MRRTEIRIRQAEGIIEILHPARQTWQHTTLSIDMKLDNRSIRDIKALLDNYLDKDYLPNNTWDMRIAEQTKIGAELWNGVFGKSVDFDPGSWLHFIPEVSQSDSADFIDFICKVPWAMLTRGALGKPMFMALDRSDPVAITVDAGSVAPLLRRGNYNILQPPTPRLLLVMPEVSHTETAKNTGAASHRDALLKILKPHYEAGNALENIKCVRSFAEFEAAMLTERFDPQIIYFYGHGTTPGAKGTKFQFDNGAKEDWQDVGDIAFVITQVVNANGNPPFIWFNACLGAAANQDSALRLFSETASCVVAMRTVVRMDASRILAERALKAIIVDRFSPPVAVREVLRNCPTDWMRSGHWASTVVAAQFTDWTALGNDDERVAEDDDAVGNFPIRVDRSDALGRIESRLKASFTVPAASEDPAVLFWSGSADQMPVIFEERVRDVVVERFPGHKPVLLKVELQATARPKHPDELDIQLRAAIFRGLSNSPDVPVDDASLGRIRRLIANMSPGRNGVLLLLHGTLTALDADLVKAYMRIWKSLCDDLKDNPNAPRVALAFGFDAELGQTFEAPEGQDVVYLGAVPPAEIKTHLGRYRRFYNIAPADLETESHTLARDTEGSFKTLLEKLERKAGFRR